MAITKIHSINKSVEKALRYILDPDKTEGTLLSSGFMCTPLTAHIDFKMTEYLVKSSGNSRGRSKTQAFHLIQSFSKDDALNSKTAHEIGYSLASELTNNNHEFVLATHTDKNHIHNHIILNAYSASNLNKFRTAPYKTVKLIRDISDNLCRQYNLNVLPEHIPSKDKTSTGEYYALKEGRSWKSKLKSILDNAVNSTAGYNEFKAYLADNGVAIKEGKHISFRAADQERFTRGKTIGPNYTKDSLIKRINKKKLLHFASLNCISKRPIPIVRHVNYKSRKYMLAKTHELAAILRLASKENIKVWSDFNIRVQELKSLCDNTKLAMNNLIDEAAEYSTILKYLNITRNLINSDVPHYLYNQAIHELELRGINPQVDTNLFAVKCAEVECNVNELKYIYQQTESRVLSIVKAQSKLNSYLRNNSRNISRDDIDR